MVNIKRTITYRWTPRDAENLKKAASQTPTVDKAKKWADYQDRKVTPYGFVREMLPDCEKYAAGSSVPIDLTRSTLYPFEVQRFASFPADVEWLDVDAEVGDASTLGDLCDKLLALGKGKLEKKYGGLYDSFGTKDDTTKLARRELARAIFDHWDNTSFRYGVVTAGGFDWTSAFNEPWSLPAKADVDESDGTGSKKTVTYRVARVPTHKPIHVAIAAGPSVRGRRNVIVEPPRGEPPKLKVGFNYPWAWFAYGDYFGAPSSVQRPKDDPKRDEWLGKWVTCMKPNLRRIKELGMEYVRIFLVCNGNNWGTPEGSPGHYTFDPPDEINPLCISQLKEMLMAFREEHLKVIPSFVDFGLLAEAYPNFDGKGHPWGGGSGRYDAVNRPECRAKLLNFLQALLDASSEFKSQIYAWEVINEPSWNTRMFSPPTRPPNASPALPHRTTVDTAVMRAFLGEACKRIEDAGFESTVGHRFYCDLSTFPTGTKPQFHYYAQVYPDADDEVLPRLDSDGKIRGQEVFIGEIAAGSRNGQPWPALLGRDAGDARTRVFERLKDVARRNYRLVLIWPDLSWDDVDPKQVPRAGKGVMTWDEFKADPVDPLELSPQAQEGVLAFTSSLFRNGVPDPEYEY